MGKHYFKTSPPCGTWELQPEAESQRPFLRRRGMEGRMDEDWHGNPPGCEVARICTYLQFGNLLKVILHRDIFLRWGGEGHSILRHPLNGNCQVPRRFLLLAVATLALMIEVERSCQCEDCWKLSRRDLRSILWYSMELPWRRNICKTSQYMSICKECNVFFFWMFYRHSEFQRAFSTLCWGCRMFRPSVLYNVPAPPVGHSAGEERFNHSYGSHDKEWLHGSILMITKQMNKSVVDLRSYSCMNQSGCVKRSNNFTHKPEILKQVHTSCKCLFTYSAYTHLYTYLWHFTVIGIHTYLVYVCKILKFHQAISNLH